VWNAWWTWDPRLTTATIVELIYAAYLMLRQGIEDPDRRAKFGAVYAILGFVSVPLTFLSIRLLRTIHPVVIGGGDPGVEGSFDMTPKMLQTFLFSLFVFSVLFADLLWHRIRMGKLAHKVEQLRLKVIH
jgi:heme exporter protein C